MAHTLFPDSLFKQLCHLSLKCFLHQTLDCFCLAALLHSYSRTLNGYFAEEQTMKDVFRASQ